jgi:hypothetical protein
MNANRHDEFVHTAAYWHERAEEALARGEGMQSPDAKEAMRQIAAIYDKLAKRAAEREKFR